jgi:maltose alpha-D-glucosyltransferase/alpha-amylase
MRHYFGDGDQMHLLLNFYLCNHLFLSMATGEAAHIERSWEELHDVPEDCGWANFVRNHDELSLDQLTKEERETVFKAFGPSKDMQLYDRGIRRRLAPMVDGDLRRIKLTYALLLSLPGTPVINMGEEIGLGDDLTLKDRNSARTPMQWSPNEANAGFSTAPSEKLVRPVIAGGPFGYQHVNVEAQQEDRRSMLHFIRRGIRAYHASPAFGTGEWSFIETGEPSVLAHRCECPGDRIYAVHNLSDQPRTVRLSLPPECDELFSDADYGPARDGQMTLSPYGFRWLRAREQVPAERP